jgi:hypothetical protein
MVNGCRKRHPKFAGEETPKAAKQKPQDNRKRKA